MRTGGAFKEDADVDDGGADADLCDSRKRGLPGRSGSDGDGARASSVMRKLRTESFCGAKKSANTVYES